MSTTTSYSHATATVQSLQPNDCLEHSRNGGEDTGDPRETHDVLGAGRVRRLRGRSTRGRRSGRRRGRGGHYGRHGGYRGIRRVRAADAVGDGRAVREREVRAL